MKRGIAMALALVLAVSLLCGTVSAVSRENVRKWSMQLADELDYTEMTHAEETVAGPKNILQEHVLTYEPGKKVQPMVIYGSTLYGRSTMSKIAAYLEDENLALVAGVNGSFFDMSTGIPYGAVVTDGFARAAASTPSASKKTARRSSETRTCTCTYRAARSAARKFSTTKFSRRPTASAFTRATMTRRQKIPSRRIMSCSSPFPAARRSSPCRAN